MKLDVRPVDYFSGTVASDAQQAHEWLSGIADAGVNLLAFCAVPSSSGHTQLTLFPDDSDRFLEAIQDGPLEFEGPQKAFLVQGDDRLGAAAQVYGLLAGAGVDVYSATGVTDGRGGFGYVIYVRPADFERARQALASGIAEAAPAG